MVDIIYFDYVDQYNRVEELLKQEFPYAIVKDASDDVHPYRFTIEMPDEKYNGYCKFMLETGLVLFSLSFHIGNIKGEVGTGAKEFLERLFELKKSTHIVLGGN